MSVASESGVTTCHSYRVRVFSCLSAVIWTMGRPIAMLPILASVEGGLAICERNGRYHIGGVVPRSAINKTDLGPRPSRHYSKDEYGVTVGIDVSFLVRTPSTFDCFTVVRAHRRIYLQYLFWTASRSFHLSLLFPRLRYALFLAVPLRSMLTRVPSHACPRFISLDSRSSYCWCQAWM